jgi:hypothetical protein
MAFVSTLAFQSMHPVCLLIWSSAHNQAVVRQACFYMNFSSRIQQTLHNRIADYFNRDKHAETELA